MGLLDRFRGKKGNGDGEGGQGNRPSGPVDEGEIMFIEPSRGMLNTKSGMALNFHPSECRGFEPAARNIVAIDRIDGMQAFGLTLVSEVPPPMFTPPAIPDGAVETLLEEALAAPSPKSVSPETLTAQLPSIDWASVFPEVNRKEGGFQPKDLIAALTHIQRPFERVEIEEILAIEQGVTSLRNPLARIEHRWPRSWLSFLSWSNGGDFVNGERCFQDMFSVEQVREFTTLYGIAHYLPGAVPFAMDGGAALYLFDTRKAPVGGEYPIAFCHSSETGDGWAAVTQLEDSFLACCQSTVNPIDV